MTVQILKVPSDIKDLCVRTTEKNRRKHVASLHEEAEVAEQQQRRKEAQTFFQDLAHRAINLPEKLAKISQVFWTNRLHYQVLNLTLLRS